MVFVALENTGQCFSTKLKTKRKNSGTSEGKKVYSKKVLNIVLHQAIQLLTQQ